MTETEAKELADKILDIVLTKGQWCNIKCEYRGKELHQIKMEISIKIKK